jgi:3-phenylpropionate/cinnamic acid dioxygenase small subunit
VSARDEIAALVYGYAERIDAGDLEGVAALFADATYGAAGGPERQGAAAVLDAIRRVVILHDGVPRTRHVVTNLVVEVDEGAGTAAARSYFTVLQATRTLPLQPILAGRYHDRFRYAGGIWRFAERRIHVDLVGDVSQHMRPATMSRGGSEGEGVARSRRQTACRGRRSRRGKRSGR